MRTTKLDLCCSDTDQNRKSEPSGTVSSMKDRIRPANQSDGFNRYFSVENLNRSHKQFMFHGMFTNILALLVLSWSQFSSAEFNRCFYHQTLSFNIHLLGKPSALAQLDGTKAQQLMKTHSLLLPGRQRLLIFNTPTTDALVYLKMFGWFNQLFVSSYIRADEAWALDLQPPRDRMRPSGFTPKVCFWYNAGISRFSTTGMFYFPVEM